MAHIDRISSLPEKPLIHILSFLKAKEVVQTSLLAERYQHLWASVPVLYLDFSDFQPCPNLSPGEHNECQDKFVQFVSGILEHRNPTDLEAFELKWEYDSDPTPAEEWLERVVQMKPKVIHFDVFTDGYSESDLTLDVPDFLFVCKSLVDMVINLQLINYEVIKPRSIKLPCLKRLTFSSVLMIDKTMKKLMSGCPSLEELVLCNCDLSISEIRSGSLKRLALDSCKQDYDYKNPVIKISAPKLEYLEITSFYMGKMKFDNMPSLERVFAHFGGLIIDSYQSLSNYEPVFLTSLSNATTLFLELTGFSNDVVKVMKRILNKEVPNFPIFRNLKTLTLGVWCMTQDFGLVALFLRNAPNLEKLILLHSNSKASSSSMVANHGLRAYLDSVEIQCNVNDESVQELVTILHAHVQTIRVIDITRGRF